LCNIQIRELKFEVIPYMVSLPARFTEMNLKN
jgi:hypothetical protein